MKKITFSAVLLSSVCCLPLVIAMEKTEVGAEYDPENGLLGLKRDTTAKMMSKEPNDDNIRNVYGISQEQQPWIKKSTFKMVKNTPFEEILRSTDAVIKITGGAPHERDGEPMPAGLLENPAVRKKLIELITSIGSWMPRILPVLKNGEKQYKYPEWYLNYGCLNCRPVKLKSKLQDATNHLLSAVRDLKELENGILSDESIADYKAFDRNRPEDIRSQLTSIPEIRHSLIGLHLDYAWTLKDCIKQLLQNDKPKNDAPDIEE